MLETPKTGFLGQGPYDNVSKTVARLVFQLAAIMEKAFI